MIFRNFDDYYFLIFKILKKEKWGHELCGPVQPDRASQHMKRSGLGHLTELGRPHESMPKEFVRARPGQANAQDVRGLLAQPIVHGKCHACGRTYKRLFGLDLGGKNFCWK